MRFGLIAAMLLSNIFMFADTGLIPLGDVDKLDLVYPNQVSEGPDTNIYVYDEKDSFIKVFSPAGKLLKTMAGPGEGPGFIKRPDGVHFGFTPAKLIYITEFFGGHRWITLLNPDGSLKETFIPNITIPIYGVTQISSLQDGTFLIEFAFSGIPEKKGNFFLHSASQTIYHIDSKGNLLAKIKETNSFQRISYLPRGADVALPYAPYNLWIPYGKNSILFTDGMDNALLILDYKGNTIGRIETELPGVPLITGQDLVKWRTYFKEERTKTQSDRERYNKFGKVIEEYKTPVYKKKPYISSLNMTPEGNILVSSIHGVEVAERNFWVLNSKGKIMAHGKANLADLQVSAHYFFITKRDADENLMVYYLKRNKDETDDFNRLFLLLKDEK